MAQTVKEMMEDMEFGHKLIQLSHSPHRKRIAVELDIPLEAVSELNESVELMSMSNQIERNIIFKYVEDMIQLLPDVKGEGVLDKSMIAVLETLLLALDLLTHESLLQAPFSSDISDKLEKINSEVFDEEKTTNFSLDANRPQNNRGKMYEKEGVLYVDDQRQEKEKSLIYMAVIYKKTETLMERMKQFAYWLGHVKLKSSTDKVSYQEMLEGKTNVQIHERTLFYLNNTLRTLSWFFNSTSWRSNELHGFDKMEIASKLGLYR